MSFPASPFNGQTATVNNIPYVYNSTLTAWTRSTSAVANVSLNSVTTGGGVFWANGAVYGPAYTASNTPPAQAKAGDQWYFSSIDTLYEYVFDGVNYNWVDISGQSLNTYTSGNLTISGNIIPNANLAYTIGTPTARFSSLYLSGNTIDLSGAVIKSDPINGITIASNLVAGGQLTVQNTLGNIQFTVANTANAVNYLQITGNTTTSSPTISTIGSDTNISLQLTPKGSGNVYSTSPFATTQNFITNSTTLPALVMNAPGFYEGIVAPAGTQLWTLGWGNSGSIAGQALIWSSNGAVLLPNTTSSTSTTTGALQVSGGAGIAGNLNIGGNIVANNTPSNSTIIQAQQGTAGNGYTVTLNPLQSGAAGPVIQIGTVASQATYMTIGAYNSLNNIENNTRNLAINFTGGFGPSAIVANASTGNLAINSTTTSTSTTTGALQVAGGAAITGNVYIGGLVSATGAITAGGLITASQAGFQSASYSSGRNRIWSFGNSDAYGISYFQGAGGFTSGVDMIGMHFGTASVAGSQFSFVQNGNFYASGDVVAYYSSDIKFKENVQDIPNALDIAINVGGKLYDWTDDFLKTRRNGDTQSTDKHDFGLIAQDLLKWFPVAVKVRPDGSLAVDYPKLSAVSFAAVKELSAKVDAQQQVINDLILRIEKLEQTK